MKLENEVKVEGGGVKIENGVKVEGGVKMENGVKAEALESALGEMIKLE